MLSRASSMPFDWNDEAVEALKKLWAQGLTATQIADEMGDGLSRSAVLGKVRRLKLPARQSPTTTVQERAAAGRARAAAQRGAKPGGRPRKITVDTSAFDADPLPEEELGNDVTHLVGIMRLDRRSCRWPVRGEGSATLFCGKHADHGPYCPEHSERAGAGYGRGARS